MLSVLGKRLDYCATGMIEDWEQGYFTPKIIYTLLLGCCLATCTWLVDSKKFVSTFVKSKKYIFEKNVHTLLFLLGMLHSYSRITQLMYNVYTLSNNTGKFYRVSCPDFRYISAHHHEFIVREDHHETLSSSSCHVADGLPGVGGWVVHVNGVCCFII